MADILTSDTVQKTEEPAVPVVEEVVTVAKKPKGKGILIAVIIGMILLLGLAAGAFGAWWYFSDRGDGDTEEDVTADIEDEDADTDEEESDEDEDADADEETDEDGTDEDDDEVIIPDEEPLLSEATDDDSWTFPTGIFDSYTYLRTLCDSYGGFDPDVYYMDVEYPDYVSLTTNWNSTDINPDCHLQFTYGTSMMRVQFDVGEGYPVNLAAGYQELLTVGGETLIRTATTLAEGMYGYSYMTKQADADCAPSEMIPELSAPCALPIHPFLPGATMIYVAIPESTGLSERGDIIDLFDDIALRMHGGDN